MQSPTSPISVLIIDDDPVELTLITQLLEIKGFRVIRAEDGLAGIEAVQASRPDIILLDIRMPGLDGFETCRRLKSLPAVAHIPVIFLTGAGREEDVVAGFRVGAIDYVTKPFRSEEILARITTHAGISRRLSRYASTLDTRVEPGPPLGETVGESRDVQQIKKAVERLLKNLVDPPTLRELALEIGTNERKLSELFRQALGMTPFQFLREQRLLKAAHLLKNTDRPISLIAEQVGYCHSGDFTTAFKQSFGMTPRQFRKG